MIRGGEVTILSIPEGPYLVAEPTIVLPPEQIVSSPEGKSIGGAERKEHKKTDVDVIGAPEIPLQFNVLAKAHAIYLEELPLEENYEFLTGKNNYEIKTHAGGRIFVATDTSFLVKQGLCNGGISHHEPFSFNVFDFLGRQVLNIDGHLGGCATGACVKVNTVKVNIGSIIQGDFNSPHYVVVNWEGKELFSIHHGERGTIWNNLKLERTSPTEFGIYKTSEIERKLCQVGSFLPIQIGNTKYEVNSERQESRTNEAIKLTFPSPCDLPSRLLLMGALFVVDYRIIKREGRQFQLRGHRKWDRFISIPCLGITFGILIAICIVVALFNELIKLTTKSTSSDTLI